MAAGAVGSNYPGGAAAELKEEQFYEAITEGDVR